METKTQQVAPEENVIFIGGKPPMNYVLAVVTQFKMGSGEVVLKARGKAISRCVDVAEIVRNKFMTGLAVREVRIATERVTNEDGRLTNVSAIEIALAQAAKPTNH